MSFAQSTHVEDSTAVILSLIISLKGCSKRKDLYQGRRIHADIRDIGLLQKNVYLGNTLISMYAKSGAHYEARQVFDELPIQDVVSWNALIAGYVQHGQGKEALTFFYRMRGEGIAPNAITYSCLLKACGITKEVDKGEQTHVELVSQKLLGNDVRLSNALINMYAKCGALTKAQKVLDELPVRDVVSWNALILGYSQHGLGRKAQGCFQLMRNEGILADAITYACTLMACAIMQDADMGKQIHDEIISQELLGNDVVIGNALIDMYAKCGDITKARKVLNELPVKDVISWNVLIAGYAQQGQGKEALGCFHQMQSEGFLPDAITYACILKLCGIMKEREMGKRIHDQIATRGMLANNVILDNALVDMYAKCGELTRAREVLDELSIRDVVSWNALISGYAQQGHGQDALDCFERMQSEGIPPDAVTYASILKVCGIMQQADLGNQIHEKIISQGLLVNNAMLGNALVDMYTKCCVLTKGQKVLDELLVRDVGSWNALIVGYAQNGQVQEALSCFDRMQSEGISPDAVTFACVLKVCGILQKPDVGNQIHDTVVNQGLLENNVLLGNALIDMYTRCGALMKAQKVLYELPVRDVASWNILIGGYAQQGHGKEALDSFYRMKKEGYLPDAGTFAWILKVVGVTRDAHVGKRLHDEIVRQGLLETDVGLGNTLIDMYVECGSLTKAQEALDNLPVQDVISWNAVIAGYAQQGNTQEAWDCFDRMQSKGFSPNVVSWNALMGAYAKQGLAEEVLGCFRSMQQNGVSPDAITLVNVLNACSHAGLVVEGQLLFENMRAKYGITPNTEHYTCIVDLFGRARHLDGAMRVIKMMPSSDYPPLWSALLGACQRWGHINLARLAFDHAVQLDRYNVATYVIMTSIYTAAGMQENAQDIERMRKEISQHHTQG